MQPILLVVLLLGYVAMATFGAWTKMAFQWPAYFVLAVAGLLGLFRLRKKFKFTPSALCLLSATLFTGYLAARAWLSPVEYLARQDLLPLVGSFIAYCTVALHIEHPKWRKAFLWVFALLIVANFAVGVYQSQYDPRWSPYWWFGYARRMSEFNAGGFFHSENHLAGFIEGTLFFILGFVLFARIPIWGRMVLMFTALLGVVALILTYSRGGIVSTGVGLFFFVVLALVLYAKFLGPQFLKYIAAFGTMFVLLTAFVGFLCWSFLEKHYGRGLTEDAGFRVAFSRMAVEQWKSSPVWGTGARTFEIESRRLTRTGEDWNGAIDKDPTFAHNDYAQLLGDYGAVGAGLGLLVLVTHLGNGLRFLFWYRNQRYERTGQMFSNSLAMGVGAVSAIVAIGVHSIIDFNLHIPANSLLFASIFGLLANPGFDSDAARTLRVPGLKPLMTLLAAVGGAWLVFKGSTAARAEVAMEQGRFYAAARQWLTAVPHFRDAATRDPHNYLAWMGIGQAYANLAIEADDDGTSGLARSWRAKAIENYEKARELNPGHVYAVMWIADELSRMGGTGLQFAEQRFQEALKMAPSLNFLRGYYGLHLMRAGKMEEAEVQIKQALASHWGGAEAQLAVDALSAWHQSLSPPPEPTPTPTPPPDPAPAPLDPARKGLLSLPDSPAAEPAPDK